MMAWLFDTLLYTGLLIAAVLVLRRPVGRWFGPQLAYALWGLPFLRLLMPPIVLPASLAPARSHAVPLDTIPGSEAATASFMAESATPFAVVPAVTRDWSELVPVMASLWAGVALAFLAWRFVTYHKMRDLLLQDARPVGEIGKVRLVEAPAVSAPVAFGVLDKVIALPPLFMAQTDRAARDLAIEHEFAHHRGHDLLANMAAQLLLALHWFNPLAWYGWRAMRRDQEAACDARVLAGKGREERLRYAALIAGIATGPRPLAFKGALAAPMACPVLGERSIVHRLRSLSMSERSHRRRWFGRSLIGASALALPLTASISYAAVETRFSSPLPPAPPQPVAAPVAPLPPAPPEALAAGEFSAGADAYDGRLLPLSTPAVPTPPTPPLPPVPPLPPLPQAEVHGVSPHDPEFAERMEEFGRAMEEWGEALGERYAAQAEAWAEAAERNAPEVVESCDPKVRLEARSQDGRPRVVICRRDVQLAASSGLRSARVAIAGNGHISADVRAQIVEDLDRQIARMESRHN
ncbi:MAG TPA: M56 family metallopeptidase [Croceibacterium sp.]|nr:M56 family metallopeptidase [Croceibacterium sp.]